MLSIIKQNKYLILWNLAMVAGISILMGWSLPAGGFFSFPPAIVAGFIFLKLSFWVTLPIVLFGFLKSSKIKSLRAQRIVLALLLVVPIGLVALSILALIFSPNSLLLQQLGDFLRSSGLFFIFGIDHLLALMAGAVYTVNQVYEVNSISLLIRLLISGSILFLIFPNRIEESEAKFNVPTLVLAFAILTAYIILPYFTLAS